MDDTEAQPWSRDEALPARSPCAVKLSVFEGPLDLLLHLIQKNEMDVADLPIAAISQQYLEYLELFRMLDIDVAADYLVMAATLAHIKSRMLLPATADEGEDPGEDPRAELARRLAEYARYKEVAATLGARALLGRDVFPASPLDPEPGPEPVLEVNAFELLEALRRALARVPPESVHHEVSLERVTLQERMLAVMDRLRASGVEHVRFEDLLLDAARTRHLVVMTFLAILELARIQALRLFQNTNEAGDLQGPIRVRLAVVAEEDGHV